MEKNGEVSDLLRNLVRRHGDGGAYAQRNRRQHGRTDDGSIDKVMEGVADHHGGDGAFVNLTVVRVAVAPEHQLLENEEQHDAAEQRPEDLRRRQVVERLGEQSHHRDAEEGADGVADQPWDQPGAKRIVNKKDAGGNEQSAQAAKQAEPKRNPERWHAPEFYDAT